MTDARQWALASALAAFILLAAGCTSQPDATKTAERTDSETGQRRLSATEKPAVIVSGAVSIDQASSSAAGLDLSVPMVGDEDTCTGWNAGLARCQTGTFAPGDEERPSAGIGAASAEELLQSFDDGSGDRLTSDPSRVVDQIGRPNRVSDEAASVARDFMDDGLPPDRPEDAKPEDISPDGVGNLPGSIILVPPPQN